jgi:transcriptional regulator with XRE-family HTH domain
MSQGELERRIGAPDGIASKWLKLKQRPGLGFALAMERILGVPAKSWLDPDDTEAV